MRRKKRRKKNPFILLNNEEKKVKQYIFLFSFFLSVGFDLVAQKRTNRIYTAREREKLSLFHKFYYISSPVGPFLIAALNENCTCKVEKKLPAKHEKKPSLITNIHKKKETKKQQQKHHRLFLLPVYRCHLTEKSELA